MRSGRAPSGRWTCTCRGCGGPGGPRPPRGTRLFAYDTELSARNPAAPRLDASLVEAMRRGQEVASLSSGSGMQEPRRILVRMPWGTGPCAFVLVHWPERFGPREKFPSIPLEFWLFPSVLALAGVLFALGPVVGRLRQLTREVRTFVGSAYQGSITLRGNDEISELARAFDEAGHEVRAQMELKETREQTLRSFLENTTHDVMIPLTVLQGHLAELQQRAARGETVDDGPGIPENELPHVVERRVRGDAARTRGPGGHSLGLNIAWRVSVLHDWRLQLGPSEYGGLQVDFLGELPPPS
ncbi:sensor histidine kinase [Archangium gephyra]|nr:sensor histidine kinase [Archangium gephyra]